jgi:hypothetical protein
MGKIKWRCCLHLKAAQSQYTQACTKPFENLPTIESGFGHVSVSCSVLRYLRIEA